MKVNSYEMIIWWSAEDDAYVVDVPELPGCMAHGATRQEAGQFRHVHDVGVVFRAPPDDHFVAVHFHNNL